MICVINERIVQDSFSIENQFDYVLTHDLERVFGFTEKRTPAYFSSPILPTLHILTYNVTYYLFASQNQLSHIKMIVEEYFFIRAKLISHYFDE